MIWTVVLYWMHDSKKYEIVSTAFSSYWQCLLWKTYRTFVSGPPWNEGYWFEIEKRNVVEVVLMVEPLHSPHTWFMVLGRFRCSTSASEIGTAPLYDFAKGKGWRAKVIGMDPQQNDLTVKGHILFDGDAVFSDNEADPHIHRILSSPAFTGPDRKTTVDRSHGKAFLDALPQNYRGNYFHVLEPEEYDVDKTNFEDTDDENDFDFAIETPLDLDGDVDFGILDGLATRSLEQRKPVNSPSSALDSTQRALLSIRRSRYSAEQQPTQTALEVTSRRTYSRRGPRRLRRYGSEGGVRNPEDGKTGP